MGLEVSSEALDVIASLCSKEAMMKVGSKFDESWAHQQLIALGRCKDPGSFNPVARVTTGADPAALDAKALAFLDQKWQEEIEAHTGIRDYEELATTVRAAFARR